MSASSRYQKRGEKPNLRSCTEPTTHSTSLKTQPTQMTCPWCSIPRPTLLHRLWDYTAITKYWDSILAYIGKITKTLIPKDCLLCLFGYAPPTSSPPMRGPLNISQWAHRCLLVARRTLMAHWITTTPPNLPAVKRAMLSLFYLEKLDPITLNFRSTSRFFTRWRKYIEATFTQNFLQEVMYPFRYTDCYLKRDLANSLGNLKVSNLSDPSTFLPP